MLSEETIDVNEDERRLSRRFHLTLPLIVKYPQAEVEALAQTRDVSFRGLYFSVDREFPIGSPVEFELTLPKEITLADDVRIRCSGRIIRIETPNSQNRWGVAAQIDNYEFLAEESDPSRPS